MTTDSAGANAKRRRGTGFPQYPLAEAVQMIVDIGRHGPEHAPAAAAAYLGHETDNSGQFRGKLATLRDWSLITRGNDRIVLTDIGKRFTLADDPLGDRAALVVAFFSSKVFSTVYENSAKDTPLPVEALKKRAVLEFGVAPDSADKFVNSLVQSAMAAGLAQSTGDRVTFLTRDAAEREDAAEIAAVPQVERPTAETGGSSSFRRSDSSTPTLLRQAWPAGDGEVVLLISGSRALPAKAFSLIADVVAAAERLAGALGPVPDDPEDQ